MDYQKLADKLLEGGDARSAVFRQGMIDNLKWHVEALDVDSPYQEGTVEYDAYFAGQGRGNNEWRYALHANGNFRANRAKAIAYFKRLIKEAV